MIERRRSLLLGGLAVTLGRPGALVWTYLFNLGLALLFSLRLHAQLADILDHSLESERLTSGFDIGSMGAALERISAHQPATGWSGYAGIALYVALYFILVPGTLSCYLTGAPARLGVLAGEGLAYFWRFVRVTLLTLVLSALLLVPLLLAQGAFSDWLLRTHTGIEIYWLRLPGLVLILLVACLLRLYFDLVEVYTVQQGLRILPSGRSDRRVLRTLRPAFHGLRLNFGRLYGSFVLLTLAGFAAMLLLSRVALHMLAQPRAWPMFLLAQAGLFLMLLTRFWQRGAETVLAQQIPAPLPPVATAEDELLPAGYIRDGTRIVREDGPVRPLRNDSDAAPVPEVMTVPVTEPTGALTAVPGNAPFAPPVVEPTFEPTVVEPAVVEPNAAPFTDPVAEPVRESPAQPARLPNDLIERHFAREGDPLGRDLPRDPVPGPEPIAPSLEQADPGVFRPRDES